LHSKPPSRTHVQIEQELLRNLRSRNYRHIFSYLDRNCRTRFRTEESGETFESFIDWCAKNSTNIEDTKQFVFAVFDRYYWDFPKSVQAYFKEMAVEVGINLNKPKAVQYAQRMMRMFD
jgi:hypothetical protein